MGNRKELRNLIYDLGRKTALALTIAAAFLLVLVGPQPAQAQTFTVLYNFTGREDGANPAGVTLKGGNLYGTAGRGGLGYGTVYELKHNGSGWRFNPLYTFAGGSDGANPASRVVFGPQGVLYGTTYEGGESNSGTVFKLQISPSACKSSFCPWIETVLHSFGTGRDGVKPAYGDLVFDHVEPLGNIVLDANGNLYGTTVLGGTYGYGVVWQITP